MAARADEGRIAPPKARGAVGKAPIDPFAATPFDDPIESQPKQSAPESNGWKSAPRLTVPKPPSKADLVDIPTSVVPPKSPTPAIPKSVKIPAPTTDVNADALPLLGKKPLPLPPTIPQVPSAEPDRRANRSPTDASADPPSVANAVANTSMYRPLAAVVVEGERQRGAVGDLEWAAATAPLPSKTPLPPPTTNPSSALPVFVEEQQDLAPPVHTGADSYLQMAPGSVLWSPPLAQQRAPRIYAKGYGESGGTLDAGFGGQFGLARICSGGCRSSAFEVDVFAAAFGRYVDGDRLRLLDVRFGVPLVYAAGNWRYKLAYEGTTGHEANAPFARNLGDAVYRRHEAVIGAAYHFDCRWRAYGEAAGAVDRGPLQRGRARYDLGVEWAATHCTPWTGEPFAAANVEWREEQDYTANVTLQVGWQWRARTPGRGPRVALEYYNGKSPFGANFQADENWIAAVAAWDW